MATFAFGFQLQEEEDLVNVKFCSLCDLLTEQSLHNVPNNAEH